MTMTPPSQPVTNDASLLPTFKDLQAKRLEWLWPSWIPLGKLAMLDGDPGLGKSTLLLDLAARVSTGGVMPDGSQGVGGNVIILSGEDDPEDTIKPRLAAAQADEDRVFLLGEIPHAKEPRPVRIPGDLPYLGAVIHRHDARLLIVDPLMAFLSGVDANRDQDIRRALHRLSTIAAQNRCAVVCVRHLNKSEAARAIYRGNSSIGIIGHARTGLLVAQDPEDNTQRILAASKCNMAVRPASLRFALETLKEASRIGWRGASAYQADQLVRRPLSEEQIERGKETRDTDQRCQAFLQSLLKYGGQLVKEMKEACEDAGFSRRTTERAAHRLGVVLTRSWQMNYWSLPRADEKATG